MLDRRGTKQEVDNKLDMRCLFAEAGEVLHEVEQQLLVKGVLQQQVPYFNGRVFLENKAEIGKVDEILGPINEMVGSHMSIFSAKI